ncbi:btb poz domain containing [Lecanosticta acicola]|uniref:Btb poz domain containing n=1 Tax=Lecanosticta acicola TaxID=111012 RepID=A0AAI8Z8J7_9PEZI|nr:btb poz domain containing [Lecanosticta acicola]
MKVAKRRRSSSISSPPPMKKAWLCWDAGEKMDSDSYFGMLFETVEVHLRGVVESITVHRGILAQESEWFAQYVDNDGNLFLDEYDAQTVQTFLVWLYSDQLLAPIIQPKGPPEEHIKGWSEEMLTNLWTFAWSYNVRRLKNDIITCLIQQYMEKTEFPGFLTIQNVIGSCGYDCAFIRFFAYHRASRGLKGSSHLPDNLHEYPAGFLAHVLREVAKIRELRNDGKSPKVTFSAELACRWHEHLTAREAELCQERGG